MTLEYVKKHSIFNSPTDYTVMFNKKSLGTLSMLDDGCYVWFPGDFETSCVRAWVLKEIYDKLTELNEPINKLENV